MPEPDRESAAGGSRFRTTHWSMVLSAGDSGDPLSREALSTLCQMYWHPVYAFVRRKGYDPDTAQDLTQGFFLFLLEKNTIKTARPDKGKFRSFLLVVLKRYLTNEWKRQRAEKRGGGSASLTFSFEDAERRYALEPVDRDTPETIFEKQWIRTLIHNSLQRLKREMNSSGKPERTEPLTSILTGSGDGAPYVEVARKLGMSESALKVSIHRTRRRFGSMLREEVAQTVSEPSLVEEELSYLFSAGGSAPDYRTGEP